MDFILVCLAVIFGITGLLGCILPVIPGPPLSYAGLLIMYLWGNGSEPGNEITGRFMLVWLAITVIITILDYIVPVFFTRITGGSKEAARCAIAGTIIGMLFFPPFGIIIGAFAGAFLGEIIINNKKIGTSFLSAIGSFIGFVFGTGIKLMASGLMMYYIIKFI